MKPLLILVACIPALATTTISVAPNDISATQAIVRVVTDQSVANCTYRASEGASFNALINDVNPALFPGSNSDARSGSVITPQQHIFVLGTHTSGQASDNKFYSRSLQPVTQYWVGGTCGGDAEVSTTFYTANIPLGNDAPMLMPFNANAFGNVAVPSIDWTNRSTPYNDPMTGAKTIRATDSMDIAFDSANQLFTYGISSNGHWTNPSNAISGNSASLATCDTSGSCTTSDGLDLIAVIPNSATEYKANGAWDIGAAFTDFLVRMWGSGTDSNPTNRTVQVGWSIDNQTFATTPQTIVLPQTVAAFAGTAPQSWSIQSPWSAITALKLTNIVVSGGTATVNFAALPGLATNQQICINGIRNSITTAQGGNGLNGCHTITGTGTNSVSFPANAYPGTYTDGEMLASPSFPQPLWGSWGNALLHSQVGTRSGGTVTSSGTALTLSSSGTTSYFDTTWVSGTKIFITGSSSGGCAGNLCTISSVTDSTHLTLVESPGVTGATWTSASFSLLIKKTTAIGAVSVSAAYDFINSANYNAGLDGSGDIASSVPNTVSVDAQGNSIAPTTGYLTVGTPNFGNFTPIYIFIPSTGETRLIARGYQQSVGDYRSWIGWDATNGNCWFTNYPSQSVFHVCYNGDYRALTPGAPQSTNEADTPEQLTFTDIFAGTGNDIPTQIANCVANSTCNATPNTALFGVPPAPPQTGAAIRGSYMVMCGGTIGGNQDSPGYMSLWNVSSVPARLSWLAYTFDKFPVGYSGVHACLSFGTGQFNIASLNGAVGQLSGPMRGPWQQTPIMYDKGSGFSSNTSVLYTDGYDCPAGLSAQWQALGAKPVAMGGVARCLGFIVPGDFCSLNATSTEASVFPCTGNVATNHSLIKPIAEGDEVGDSMYGQVTYGEKMLVVKVTQNSPSAGEITLIVFRYSNAAVTPAAGFTCGTYGASEWNHAPGWTMWALPYHGCWGSTYWINAIDSTFSYAAENPNILGIHSDFGPGSSGFSYIEGGYVTRTNEPMPAQIGGVPNGQITGNPNFGSTHLPDIYMQFYPSKRQQVSLTPTSELDWAIDVRSYNPSGGNNAESPENLFGNTVTLVGGCASTYLVTFAGSQSPDPKVTGFVAWSGYHMLYDISAPGTGPACLDSTPWALGYALNNGEVVSGSTAGQLFVSIPKDDTGRQCTVNSYSYNAPCISNNYPYGFWPLQFLTTGYDSVGTQARRISSSFIAPGRQYNFANAKSTPDGKWTQVLAQWTEGQRTDMYWVKNPPFPATKSINNTQAGSVSDSFGGVSGDTIRVKFWYAEYANATNPTNCSTRSESCYTSSSATTTNPYVYSYETQHYTSCSSGCGVPIPARAGMVLYSQAERKNGSAVTLDQINVTMVQ